MPYDDPTIGQRPAWHAGWRTAWYIGQGLIIGAALLAGAYLLGLGWTLGVKAAWGEPGYEELVE